MAVTEKLSTHAFLTKAEVREHIFAESSEPERTSEELNALYRLVDMVCQGCESYIGKPIIIVEDIVQYDDGGADEIFLNKRPVSDVTEVVEDGTTLTVDTDYAVYPEQGVVRRITGSFVAGVRTVKVTYNAGYGTQTRDGSQELSSVTNIPYDFKLAALIWILQEWRHGPENYSPQQSETVGRWGTGIPREAADILDRYKAGPSVV